MTTAILDTNVLVQSFISSRRSASVRTLEACYDGRFRLVYSPDSLDEVLDVLMLPQIRDRHGMNDTELLDFIASLLVDADRFSGAAQVSAEITRDVTDTKFLALAAESAADYPVTNDRRHLLPLKQYGETRIVTPSQFLRKLS